VICNHSKINRKVYKRENTKNTMIISKKIILNTYFDGIVVNSSNELLKALPLLKKGEKIYLVERFDKKNNLLNQISKKEFYKMDKIISGLKKLSRHKDYLLKSGKWIIEDKDRFLLIEKGGKDENKK
jgi:hypothetical protein